MQTFENLLQNYSMEFLDIVSLNTPWECVINVCSNGGATCIISKIIVKRQFEHIAN